MHKITEIDEVAGTGLCAACGQRVGVYPRRDYWACRPHATEIRKAHWSRLTPEQKQGRKYRAHHVTESWFVDTLARQGGHCRLCPETVDLVIDHDHRCCPGPYSCGKCVRGLLCHRCNRGIGQLGDDADRLLAAAAYVKEF
jgi:hypothetical protein